MDWCSENVQQNQNKEDKGLAAAAAVTQAARDRKAGCLPPFIGQSGQSGAPAAKKAKVGKQHLQHGKSYQGDVAPTNENLVKQVHFDQPIDQQSHTRQPVKKRICIMRKITYVTSKSQMMLDMLILGVDPNSLLQPLSYKSVNTVS